MWKVILLIAPALLSVQPAAADLTFTVTADTLVGSEPGTLVRVEETGDPGETLFAFEFGGMVQVRAKRPDGADWQIYTNRLYLCPVAQMQIGQTWRFLGGEADSPRTAEAVAIQNVSVPAGDFSCWRVDVSEDDLPGTVVESYWFSSGEGLVQRVEWEGGVAVSRQVLSTSAVDGSGFFPLVSGNSWTYVDDIVPASVTSVGILKARHVRD